MEIDFHDADEFEKWAARLAPRDLAKVLQMVTLLEESSIPVGMPHGRNLKDGLWELRPQSGRSIYRIYYTPNRAVALVLMQGRKDTQARDITQARKRMR